MNLSVILGTGIFQFQGVKWSHPRGHCHAYGHFTVVPFLRDTVKVFKLILRFICWDFRTGLFDLTKNCIFKVERWTLLWVHKCVLKKTLKYEAVDFQDYLAFSVWGLGKENWCKEIVKNWWLYVKKGNVNIDDEICIHSSEITWQCSFE